MTLFEYLAAGYVLILSFAVIRGVSGVPYALRPSSRYGVHFVHLSNVLTMRIPLFASGAATFIAIAVCHQAILGIPALHPYEWPLYTAVAIYAVGLTSPKPSLHAGLALANFCIIAAIAIGILAQQDPLTFLIP